jgi:hypothetical protein
MIDEKSLQDILVAAFEHLKTQYETLSAMMAETAALRETLKETGGDYFASAFERRRGEFRAANTPIEAAAKQSYDEIIQRLKVGGA